MEKTFKEDLRIIIITALFLILSILGIWFLWEDIILLTVTLFFLALIELSAIGSRKLAVVFFLCGIGGGIVEIVAVHFGAWNYTEPTFLNIPLWLLPGWGNAGIIIVTLYKLLGNVEWLNKK